MANNKSRRERLLERIGLVTQRQLQEAKDRAFESGVSFGGEDEPGPSSKWTNKWGYRRQRVGSRDVTDVDYHEAVERCWSLFMSNPVAKRLVEMRRDQIVDTSIRPVATDDKVQEVIDRFWNDPVNNMGKFVYDFALQQSLFGTQCVTGDTMIHTLRGMKRIDELVEELPAYVVAFDEKAWCPRVALVSEGGQTGVKPVYRVRARHINRHTIDEIRCTANHRFLLTNGEWCRADELKPGDSLQSVYSHVRSGYEYMFVGGKLEPTHKWVYEGFFGESPEDTDIHHCDYDKRNNEPTNLTAMAKGKHVRLHHLGQPKPGTSHSMRQVWNPMDDPEIRERAQLHRKMAYASLSEAECKQKCSETVRKGWKTRREHGLDHWALTPKQRMHISLGRRQYHELFDEEWVREHYIRRELSTLQIADMLGCDHNIVSDGLKRFGIPRRGPSGPGIQYPELHDKDWLQEQRDHGLSQKAIAGLVGCTPGSVSHAYRRAGVPWHNHTVVSVESCGTEPVYNLNVEPYHTYVANKMVVHNCFPTFVAVEHSDGGVVGTGRVRLGYVDPGEIQDIVLDPDNARIPVAAITKGQDRIERCYRVVHVDETAGSDTEGKLVGVRRKTEQSGYEWVLEERDTEKGPKKAYRAVRVTEYQKGVAANTMTRIKRGAEASDGSGGEYEYEDEQGIPFDGACFLFRVNHVMNGKWGWPDLLHLMDWLQQADMFFFDIAERIYFLTAFVWLATREGKDDAEIRQWARESGPPKRGSVIYKNEKESWEAATPDLGQADIEKAAGMLLHFIAGIGFNIPESWLGRAQTSRYAGAKEAGAPARKTLESRQSFIRNAVELMVRFQIDQAVIAKQLEGVEDFSFKVPMPSLDVRDVSEVAGALREVAQGIMIAMAAGVLDRPAGIAILEFVVKAMGVDVELNVEDMTPEQANETRQVLRLLAQLKQVPLGEPLSLEELMQGSDVTPEDIERIKREFGELARLAAEE